MRPRDVARVLLKSGSGRAGILFFAVMVLVSLYVLARYPLNFGATIWNNPTLWADNPKATPPNWASPFQRDKPFRHTVWQSSKPKDVASVNGRETRSYTFSLDYSANRPLSFVAFSISDVQFAAAPPVVSLKLLRPDGGELVLMRHAVRGSRPGEEAPFTRYSETPQRILVSQEPDVLQATSTFLKQRYGREVTPEQLRGQVEVALFGTPEDSGSGFKPLHGKYTFVVEGSFANAGDSLREVKLVLGGQSYGLMGTDSLGRDLAVGLLFGFPVALVIGLATSLLATGLGTFTGVLSGYMGGKTDMAVQRFADVLTNVPLLPILIFLIFILGQRLWLVVVILVAFGWPGLAIVVRSMVLQIRSGQLVEATQSLGASRWRIMFRHVMFQIAPFVLAQLIFFTPSAILAEAGLSFLGLGDPSIPTWGQILEQGFRTGAVYVGYWWWVLPPGILIVLTAMTFVLLTLGLEPVINPRLRTSR